MNTAEELISEERARQTGTLNHTVAHDDAHRDGSLGKAGRCYVSTAAIQMDSGRTLPPCFIHKDWPWERRDWNPDRKDPVRNMVKGAALLRAEFERMARTPASSDEAERFTILRQMDGLKTEEKAAAAKIEAWQKAHLKKD